MSLPDWSQAELEQAHRFCSHHREHLETSELCGCFYCLAVYSPAEIAEWIEPSDGKGTTALCPRCGIDSVLPSSARLPITTQFLEAMQKHWFG